MIRVPEPAAPIYDELAAAGVRLWEEDGQIRYRAPRGALTARRLAALRAQKGAVLARLREADALPQVEPDPDGRLLPFPLTDVQAAYLLGRGHAVPFGGVGCHG